MLILQRRAGESLLIGEDITVSVVSIDGVRVRLAISAPDHVSILRSELVTASAANRDSAMEESAPNELLSLLGDVLTYSRPEGSPPPQKAEDQAADRPAEQPNSEPKDQEKRRNHL